MKANLKPGEFLKAVPIEKIDEAKQEAWGIFTAEVPDSDDEIADYDHQKKRVQAWSDGAKSKSAAAGQEASLGNVRLQHSMTVCGKVIALNMDDAAKTIGGGTYVMNVGDTKVWDMVAKGILQGFSFGGTYDWRKCEECGRDLPLEQGNNFCDNCNALVKVRFGASISELSVCDRPAVPVANILHIKADGSRVHQEVSVDKQIKRVGGEDLAADCFAYVGDAEKPATWLLAVKGFSTSEKTKQYVVRALALFGAVKGIPADKRAEVKATIAAAAKENGIEMDVEEQKAETPTLGRSALKAQIQTIKEHIDSKATAAGVTMRKDLYDVANMAELLQRIAWLRYSAIQERDYEGDDSEIPEALDQNLISLGETFLAMAAEETAELVAAAKKAGKVTTMDKNETTVPANVGDLMTGHIVSMAANHEVMADAHKAMAEEHTAKSATHKAIHEHFKKAAEEGGEHEEHHAMHADGHKAIMEHHETKSAHHMSMHKAHCSMAEMCGKAAESMGDTPEKAEKIKGLLKAARDAKPAVVKSGAAPVVIDPANLSATEKAAFDRVNEAWLNSDEYKKMTTDALRAQTMAKLNAQASSAAILPGVDTAADGIFRVDRSGQSNKAAAETESNDEIFSFTK